MATGVAGTEQRLTASTEAWIAVSQRLAHEAELLDSNRWREWLALVAEDIEYSMPVRASRNRGSHSEFSAAAGHFVDSYETLKQRLARLETEYAWAEDPPTRTRHHVGTVRVGAADWPRQVTAKSNLLYFRSRGAENDLDATISAERHDLWRAGPDGLLLAQRIVYVDQTRLPTHNLTGVL
jgi:3-phenylpropionate/cinnamic acid dioxygenase small subunit